MKTIGLENNDLYIDEYNNLGIKDGLEKIKNYLLFKKNVL